MSFFIKIQEKILLIKKYLQKNSEGFQNKEIVWKYLEQIELRQKEENILKSAFRTRLKIEENNYIFQFRISPNSLSDQQLIYISDISESLKAKLQKILPKKDIEIQIKISDCCGKNCYGCDTYGSIE